jgi:PAS domain S-box-containing protein
MSSWSPRTANYASFVLPATTVIIAIAIFVADTLSGFEVAVSSLYASVVLLAVRFLDARGVILVGAGCIGLAVLSHLVTRHGELSIVALANLLIGILTIVVVAYLALQNQSAQIALREKAGLVDLTHDTMFVRDMTDVITFWNRAAEQLYGWNEDEAIGRRSHDLMQTVFPAPLDKIMDELSRTGHWAGELVHTARDDRQVTVASRWSMLKDGHGRPVAILETNNDITERKRGEEKLRQAQAELAHINRTATLGELTAAIAHETNQPLAAIVTNGEASLRFLDRDQPDLNEVRDALHRMIDCSRSATEITQRLRALFKKTDAAMAPIEMNGVIKEVVPLVQQELRSHDVSLQLALTQAQLPILGDRIQLQQVIVNLVLKGRDANVSVGNGPGELLIQTSDDGAGQAVVAVTDSGIGLDPESEEGLFRSFYTTKPTGMGMGLSICRSIIELHGGSIWASRNHDRGATFQFSLPLRQDASS